MLASLLSWEQNLKEVAGGFLPLAITAITEKCVFIFAVMQHDLFHPEGVPRHLFLSPRIPCKFGFLSRGIPVEYVGLSSARAALWAVSSQVTEAMKPAVGC